MLKTLTQKPKALPARIVSGSFVLLSGSGLATATNFAYNIAVARFLGPNGFGHATAVYTLLTLISAVTLSFQIIAAKVVAQQSSAEGKYAGYRGFHRGAWACGILVALVLLAFQKAIAGYLNLPSPILVVLLAIGAAFYVPLGSRRGYLQGAYGFRRLATNLVLEGAVRLGGSLLLMLFGLGVKGVIAANSAAVAAAYLAIVPEAATRMPNPIRLLYALRETSQAIVFFSGQVLINNCDIVLVKHYFLPQAAGLYAAVAMVGRVIYAFSSAVVNSMFPLVAGTSEEERKDLKVIATSLLLVLTIGSGLALGLRFAPASIWTSVFRGQVSNRGRVRPALSPGALRHHHCHLFTECRDHHLRNVLQDCQHQLGSAGLQRRGGRGNLPLSCVAAASHPGATGADGCTAHFCRSSLPRGLADQYRQYRAEGQV